MFGVRSDWFVRKGQKRGLEWLIYEKRSREGYGVVDLLEKRSKDWTLFTLSAKPVHVKCKSHCRNFKERSCKVKAKLKRGCRINNIDLSWLMGRDKYISKGTVIQFAGWCPQRRTETLVWRDHQELSWDTTSEPGGRKEKWMGIREEN